MHAPFDWVVHARYNAERSTRYFIVPGLLGLTITASLLMVVAMSVTKERERGTMETLLATPLRPIEVLIGKMTPYIMIGYAQIIILTLAAHLLGVPILGHIWLLLLVSLPFIISNLSIGVLFSVRADNQLEAVSASTFFFLPSILLSGFMFPFKGMPIWAQIIGQVLPMTHYVHITRDIMLKGHGLINILPQLWPIVLFTVVVLTIAVKAYRSTLD
jgi:ABC-2 type transport system permease protein